MNWGSFKKSWNGTTLFIQPPLYTILFNSARISSGQEKLTKSKFIARLWTWSIKASSFRTEAFRKISWWTNWGLIRQSSTKGENLKLMQEHKYLYLKHFNNSKNGLGITRSADRGKACVYFYFFIFLDCPTYILVIDYSGCRTYTHLFL